MKRLSKWSYGLAALVAVGLLPCRALDFKTPSWASNTGARFSQWRNFTSGFGEPGNEPDVEGSNAGGVLIQSIPGGIVTGSGNIYNPVAAGSFNLRFQSESNLKTVVFQAVTIGELDSESVALVFDLDGESQSLTSQAVEIGRESGGFGDTVLTQWSWDLTDWTVPSASIVFAAQGPHLSLASIRLDTLSHGMRELIEIRFDAPDDDAWNYPFNATPGRRSAASVFREVREGVGQFRYGNFVMAFPSADTVPPGLPLASYEIVSAALRLKTTSNFETPYDPTYDDVATYLPEDAFGFESDSDPGRPVELFGTGFRNNIDLRTWTENTPFRPDAESEPTAYPVSIDANGNWVDATLSVDFTNPKNILPLAVGKLTATQPGDPIPEDAWMDFEFNLSDPATTAYLKNGLQAGRLAFTLTSLNGGGLGSRTFPEFHTSDSLVGDAPSLVLKVAIGAAATALKLSGISHSPQGIHLHVEGHAVSSVGIRWTKDFASWREVTAPTWIQRQDGRFEWVDGESGKEAKFYQLILNP